MRKRNEALQSAALRAIFPVPSPPAISVRSRTVQAITQGGHRTLLFAVAMVVFAGFLGAAPPLGAAERTIVLGQADGWSAVVRDERILEVPGRSGYLDLTLEPYRLEPTSDTELLMGFDALPLTDEAGRYRVHPDSPELTRSAQRTGTGALLVDGPEDRLQLEPRAGSAFTPGTEWASFTIEFWLYPVVLYDGDAILSWRAREGADLGFRTQELAMEVDGSTLAARFENFFVRPDGLGVSVTLRDNGRLIPRTWSHHLVRFDAATGLLEYVVNGTPVDLTYVSRTGRQDGSVFFPRIAAFAEPGLAIEDGMVGAIDAVRIERRVLGDDDVPAFSPRGGYLVSDYLDLGSSGARVRSIDATLSAPGLSDVFLYYRLVDLRERDPAAATDWRPFVPGSPLNTEGRFLQIRAELLPDTRDGLAPRLSALSVTYEPHLPPLPPTALRAVPGDGEVTVSWAGVQDPDIAGYLVYYGDQSGRYFGAGSEQGASPIDVGSATSVTIRGLENGTLYFFAVQAYASPRNGVLRHYALSATRGHELSSEVAARPAKVYE